MFDRPIGQNQAIQHPLAACWMALEAANLMAFKAASLYDAGEPCGVEANAAKYLAGEAAFKACETALMTHGGMGYAKEFHVERYLREVLIARIAPITPAADPELHRREGAGPAEVVLSAPSSPIRNLCERRANPPERAVIVRLGRAFGGALRRPSPRPSCPRRDVRQVLRDHRRIERGDGVVRQAIPDLVHAEQRNAEIAAHA